QRKSWLRENRKKCPKLLDQFSIDVDMGIGNRHVSPAWSASDPPDGGVNRRLIGADYGKCPFMARQ
ncbi:hypothetical protein, partial [Pseudomonas thivervalensis]|uniref:hypothetical protein n=1 Tax=Pseudomonas thivervalensis TaxID=86265 RepID=UPI001ADFC397